MIRSLRRAHRWLWLALLVVLPWLVAAAVAARHARVTQPLPAELAPYARPSDTGAR